MSNRRTQQRRKETPPTSEAPNREQEPDPIDTEFDKLLETEESMELLKLMGDDALKEYYRGETEEGGFDDSQGAESIHDRIQHLIAPVGGPRDLSTNKKYLGKKK